MALTRDEMEAKFAALEDRVDLLFQTTDTLESRFDWALVQWLGWAAELKLSLTLINQLIENVSTKIPMSGPDR